MFNKRSFLTILFILLIGFNQVNAGDFFTSLKDKAISLIGQNSGKLAAMGTLAAFVTYFWFKNQEQSSPLISDDLYSGVSPFPRPIIPQPTKNDHRGDRKSKAEQEWEYRELEALALQDRELERLEVQALQFGQEPEFEISEKEAIELSQQQPQIIPTTKEEIIAEFTRLTSKDQTPEIESEIEKLMTALDAIEEQEKKEKEQKVKRDDDEWEMILHNEVNQVVNTREIQTFIDKCNVLLEALRKNPYSHNNLDELVQNYYKLKIAISKFKEIANGSRDLKDIYNKKLDELNTLLDAFYKSGPWNEGKVLVEEILKGNKISTPNGYKQYLEYIINIMWYFYQLAVEKDQAFTEGTFVIQDPHYYLLRFLCRYDQFELSKGSLVYDRSNGWSSHYREYDNKYPKFGIDIPDEMRHERHFPVFNPEKQKHKFHIFFGKIEPKGFIFIKPESHGINFRYSPMDAVEHLLEWKDSIRAKGKHGADDKEDMRKERVPSEIVKVWKELMSQRPWISQKVLEDGIKFGIRKMNWFLSDEYGEVLDHQKYELLLQQFNKLVSQYDYLDIRKGREVVLTQKDLLYDIMTFAQ